MIWPGRGSASDIEAAEVVSHAVVAGQALYDVPTPQADPLTSEAPGSPGKVMSRRGHLWHSPDARSTGRVGEGHGPSLNGGRVPAKAGRDPAGRDLRWEARMRGCWVVVVSALILGSVAGCGDDASGPAPDPADATSCADLADKFAEITGELLDVIGDRTDADMESASSEDEAAGDEWMTTAFALVARVGELCDEGEFDRLLCERESGLEPGGEAGQRFLRDNYPDCQGTDTDVDPEPSGSG